MVTMARCGAVLWLLHAALAPNPLVPHVGMADPHVHQFDGQLYMYATHDSKAGNGTCCLGPWWVWQSVDMVNWKQVSLLHDFGWESEKDRNWTSRWATDVAVSRNGKYWWYVSIGGGQIAVAEGATPAGPWTDPLGRLLFTEEDGDKLTPPSNIRDPGTLQDDDGKYYIVFGACSGAVQPNDSCYYAAELNADMISYKTPVHLSVQRAMGPYGPGKCDDKPFLHKRSGLYYLSWGCFYAVSDTVYGPYHYKGSFITQEHIAPDFRIGNQTQTPWYTREDFADRHGSFLEFHGQWYFFCNDRSHSDMVKTGGNPGGYRDTVASYVHFRKDGTIAPIVIDAKGVGSHDVRAEPTVPAENFFRMGRDGLKEDFDGGFKVSGLKAGSWLMYQQLQGVPEGVRVRLRASNGHGCGDGRVELRAGSVTGQVLGSCPIPATGGWQRFVDASCRLEARLPTGPLDLVLSFVGCGGEEFVHLDHFSFLPAERNLEEVV